MKKPYFLFVIGMLLFGAPLSVSAAIEYNFTTIGNSSWGQTIAMGSNDNGNIVGYYSSGNYSHGFIYDGTGYTTFDVPGAHNTFATGISNSGDIVGYYDDSLSKRHGFLRDESGFSTIDYPNATHTLLTGINNNGDIVGTYSTTYGYTSYSDGFLKNGTGFTNIYPSGSYNSMALGINDNGSIIGIYSILIPRVGENWGYSYLRYSSGNYDSLPHFYEPRGINNNNDIVGFDYGNVRGTFIINNTGTTYLVHPDGTLTEAFDINNNGSIVGYYKDSNSIVRGFLATPIVPEPISSILFITGGSLLAGRRFIRRKA